MSWWQVPKAVDFPSGVECWTQVVHMAKIRYLLQGAAEEAAGSWVGRKRSCRVCGWQSEKKNSWQSENA